MHLNDPVIVTVYWPGVEDLNEHEAMAVAFAGRLTLEGQKTETAEGVVIVRLIVPESPRMLVRVRFPVFELFVWKETEPGPVMAKSWIVTLRVIR